MQLVDIRTAVRQRADMVNTQFVTDAELNGYINASFGELYDLLVSRFEDYFMKLDPVTFLPPTFTLANGIGAFALPSDFYKLRGLDYSNSGNDWCTLNNTNFINRNRRNVDRLNYSIRGLNYRVMNNVIKFFPPDQSNGTYRLWYVPRVPTLVADADSTSGYTMDYDEYIVVDSAIKCLVKEESDPSVLMAGKEQLKQRIIAMSANRDASAPEKISNVRGRFTDFNDRFSG